MIPRQPTEMKLAHDGMDCHCHGRVCHCESVNHEAKVVQPQEPERKPIIFSNARTDIMDKMAHLESFMGSTLNQLNDPNRRLETARLMAQKIWGQNVPQQAKESATNNGPNLSHQSQAKAELNEMETNPDSVPQGEKKWWRQFLLSLASASNADIWNRRNNYTHMQRKVFDKVTERLSNKHGPDGDKTFNVWSEPGNLQ